MTSQTTRVRIPQGDISWGANVHCHPIGAVWIPERIAVSMPGAPGEPGLTFTVTTDATGASVVEELAVRAKPGGKLIGERLRAAAGLLPQWAEDIPAVAALAEPADINAEPVMADSKVAQAALKAARSQNKRTPVDLAAVATVYNAAGRNHTKAIQEALGVSKSTAVRYRNAAREAGLIEEAAQ